jgi:hypothetical protein
MTKPYTEILKEKDIKGALEFMIPRVHSYQMCMLIRMVIKELKAKGIIEKDWLDNYFKEKNYD